MRTTIAAALRLGRGSARARARRTGFTVVELTASLGVMTVLAVAMGSAIVIATKAIPDGNSPADAARSAAAAARQLAGELHYAKSVSENTASAITFTVADRTGDGTAETIRYAWAGAGAPLTRQFNGGAAETVLADVQECRLDYVRNPVVTTQTSTTETTVAVTNPLAYFSNYTSGTITDQTFAVSANQWLSERFYLDTTQLPAGGVKRVNFTKVMIWMQLNGAPAPAASLELRTAVGGGNPLPSANVLTSTTITPPAATTLFKWVEVPLNNAALTNVNQDLCLVLRGSSATANSLTVSYKQHATGVNNKPMLLWSTNGGGSWLPTGTTDRNKQDMRFYLYGTYTVDSTAQAETTSYYLLSADLRLRAGADPAGTVVTAVPVLEHPLVTGP